MSKKRRKKNLPPTPSLASEMVQALRRLHVGRHTIGVKTTHDVDGSPASDAKMPVDQVTVMRTIDGKYNLADALRALADQVSRTDSDFDTGSAVIVVGRRYSAAALKRLGGGQ